MMRNLRPFGWLILVFNVYYSYTFAKGVIDLGQDDLAVGLYAFLSIIFWAVANIILYVLYRVTAKNKRRCPACDSPVKTGLTVCKKCQFDFMKAASGGDINSSADLKTIPGEINADKAKIDWRVTGVALLGTISVIFLVSLFSNSESNNDWKSKKLEVSKSIQDYTIDKSWIPSGFAEWDQNVAWRYLKPKEFDCGYADYCFGIMVITKDGCPNGLYAELSLVDKNGTQVGYTNEMMSTALPNQKSKLIFDTYEKQANTGRLSKISCY
jgi:hypothetical protein